MSLDLTVAWRIRECMNAAGISSARELHTRMSMKSPECIQYAQVARIVQAPPARLPLDQLGLLCSVLGCTPGDLLNPPPNASAQAGTACRVSPGEPDYASNEGVKR